MALLSICFLLLSVAPLDSGRSNEPDPAKVQNSDPAQRLAGTWILDKRDNSASQIITLVFRRDGSYTKTLDATVNGSRYGGTHSGSWTARGTVVRLSGDGNWPAYSHDLVEFRKVE